MGASCGGQDGVKYGLNKVRDKIINNLCKVGKRLNKKTTAGLGFFFFDNILQDWLCPHDKVA